MLLRLWPLFTGQGSASLPSSALEPGSGFLGSPLLFAKAQLQKLLL